MAKRPWHQVPDAVRLLIEEYVRSHTYDTTSHVDYAALASLLAEHGYPDVHNLKAAVARERRRQGVCGVAGRKPVESPSQAHLLVLRHIGDGKRNSSSYGIVDYAKLAEALAEIGFHDESPKYTRIVHLVRWARKKLGFKALPKGKHLRGEETIAKQRAYMQGRKMSRRKPDVITVAFSPCAGYRINTVCPNSALPEKAFCGECIERIRAHNERRRPVLESSGN